MHIPFYYTKPVHAAIAWFIRRMESREPDVLIGGPVDTYMRRWWVIPRNRLFNIYFHHFMRSDDDRALHDHPWWNISAVLTYPGYKEHVPKVHHFDLDDKPVYDYQNTEVIERIPGEICFRGAKTAHRIELMHTPYGVDENGKLVVVPKPIPVYTLFITGPKVRDWGFHCPKGWKDWRDFTAFHSKGNGNEVGPGCDD
jgi:hypothetical protein